MLIIQTAITYKLRVYPSWDMKGVFDEATYIIQVPNDTITSLYTDRFPNNLFLVFIYLILFKIFNISHYRLVIVTNILIINFAILMLYKASKKIMGNKKAFMCLLVSFFVLPFYMYGPIFYTDTYSLFVCSSIVYVCALMKEQKNNKKLYILQAVLAILLFVGYGIKPTSVFVFIAILIYDLYINGIKYLIKFYLFSLIFAVILNMLYIGLLKNKNIISEQRSNVYEFPKQLWIVLGLMGNGGYSDKPYNDIDKYNNYNDKKQACSNEIKDIMEQYDIRSFLAHIKEKVVFTWCDGSYFAPEVLRRKPVQNSILHSYILSNGSKNSYIKYYTQSMHFAAYTFMILYCIYIIVKKDYYNINLVFIITLLGTFAFLLIWETRSRYLFNIIPIIIMLSVSSIDKLSNILIKNKKELKLDEHKNN